MKIFSTVVCWLFTFLGIYIILTGDTAAKRFGWLVVLVFGGVQLLGFLSKRLAKTKVVKGNYEIVAYNDVKYDAIVFYKSRGKLIICGLLCLGMAFACYFMYRFASSIGDRDSLLDSPAMVRIFGLIGTPIMAAVTLFVFYHVSNFKQYLAVMRPGVFIQNFKGTVFVSWDSVQEVSIFNSSGTVADEAKLIGIKVVDSSLVERTGESYEEDYSSDVPMDWDVSILASAYAATPELMQETIEHYLTHPEDRLLIGTQPVLSHSA